MRPPSAHVPAQAARAAAEAARMAAPLVPHAEGAATEPSSPPCPSLNSPRPAAAGSDEAFLERVRELRAKGLRRCDIAERIGMSEEGLRKRLRRMGVRFDDAADLRAAKHAEASAALVARVRQLASAGHTRASIAEAMGLGEMQLHARLQRLGLSVTKLGVKAKLPPRRIKKPKPPPTTDADRLKRNPKLSALQQEQVDRHKNRMWRAVSPKLCAMPTPSRDEADALVAQFLARGGRITVAPPAAPVEIPCNAGMPFRTGRRA